MTDVATITALVAERVIRAVGAHRANESVGLSMNLVLDRPPLHPRAALALAHPCDGRQAFVVPWRGHAVVGTYDRDYPVALGITLITATVVAGMRLVGDVVRVLVDPRTRAQELA